MKITFIGHAAFKLEGEWTVYIDPFITGNPSTRWTLEDVKKADFVLVTHDHQDHLGDAVEICRKTGATLVAQYDLAVALAEKWGIKAEGMNIGGTLSWGNTKFNMVNAQHSSGTGHPCGWVIEMDGGVFYHAGDTSLNWDMKLLSEFWKIDVAFLPIGDRFTMGPRSAAKATEWLKTKWVIPMHYDTWPPIKQDVKTFQTFVGNTANVVVLKPGESWEWKNETAAARSFSK